MLKLHRTAAAIALLLIGGFWLASAAAELSGSHPLVVWTKTIIFAGVFVLLPTMAVTGYTGMRLAGRRKHDLLTGKIRRIRFMAAIGVGLLVPLAAFLWWKASAGELDGWFFAAQAVEFAAGATNFILGVKNARAGMALKAARKA